MKDSYLREDFSRVRKSHAIFFLRFILRLFSSSGFGGGAFALASPLYIVEIAEPAMRGSLASLMQFMVTLGVAFVDLLNIQDFVHWNVISGICMAFPRN